MGDRRSLLVARAVDDPALSEATAIVTGTREETRAEGFAHALRDVLVKRSGNPGLLYDARVEPLEANAADLVEDYIYLDRMSDQPRHDEQGTRDRPYTLVVRFAPEKIDAALAELGIKRVHLVGHSMGGAVAAALAARRGGLN